MTKSKLILNPDYYSAGTYMETEENAKSIYLRVFIQLLIITMAFSALILGYKYIMKHHYNDISLWLREDKVLVKNEEVPIVIREESIITKIEEKKVLISPLVSAVNSPIIKVKVVQSQEITDEYMKLMQDSLGNY